MAKKRISHTTTKKSKTAGKKATKSAGEKATKSAAEKATKFAQGRPTGPKLVIVESPAKARTVSKMLSRGYSVKASIGHVRDLPEKWLGVDVKNDFAPKYEIPKKKRGIVEEIKEAAEKASAIFLATDPDREGEAISWHLVQAAKLGRMPVKRVEFHEITTEAVTEAFKHPRDINMNLVNAQQARRILDRLVGYKISPLLCQRIRRGLSAGRVQSVALRMVVDREREIQNFVPEEYWSIDAHLEKIEGSKAKKDFIATLIGFMDGKKIKIGGQEEAGKLVASLENATYKVAQLKKKQTTRQPAPPFTTSTLQQEGWRKLRLSAKGTMAVAQQLYEGLPIGEEGSVGLITYMRTDSVNVSHSAIDETRDYITKKYGDKFLPQHPRYFHKKAKGAQEAHEAIRPTSIMREPQAIKGYLNKDQFRLYELIWKRMVSSQMSAVLFDTTAADIEATPKKRGHQNYLFRATSSTMKFPGFTILYSEGKDETEEEGEKGPLPELTKDELLKLLELAPEQHFTQPPNRYTQATLVKALEERGIGRPSTYATTLSTIRDRDYVILDGGRFCPTELGFLVNDMLNEHFPDIVNLGFTAQMEEGLDQIAQGEQEWVSFLGDFYKPFEETLQIAKEQLVKIPDEPTDEICPNCGKPMVIKTGRFGKFIACTGYPQCKTTKPVEETQTSAEPTDKICPNCGKPMVIKTGRFGKFTACTGYPQCKTTKPIKEVQTSAEPTDETCPKCGKPMVVRAGRYGKFVACSNYPRCKTTKHIKETQTPDEPTDETCPKCGKPMVIKTGRYGKFIACSSYPKCKTSRPVSIKVGAACPQCGGELVERRNRKKQTFYGCSGYPKCDFTLSDRPLPQPCPECGGLLTMRGEKMVKCHKCKFSGMLEDVEKEAVKT